jgi:pimeloyl-ACP methyl ester carboxylesterase
MRRRRLCAVIAGLAIALFACIPSGSGAQPRPRPTIVLVHGAWDSASSWGAVAGRLRDRGYSVRIPTNPLRSLRGDAAAIAEALAHISGPIVLVGHSYGGAVITNAATGNPNVRALVYIAAFAPDTGETALGLIAGRPGSLLPAALVPHTYRAADGGIGVDTLINPLLFRTVFAQDVPATQAAAMAAAQHPTALAAGLGPSGAPAWRHIPSWYLVAADDRVIPPATERFMAARAGAHTIEVRSSHAAHVSHPQETADLILAAAEA